ncbi:MAG: hypothetical protein PWP51_2831 [Clostridiales bacterium]|nr:hypothetical protein [Clostridiales bacterium]
MKQRPNAKVRSNIFPFSSFVASFFALAALTTGQMLILKNIILFDHVPTPYIAAVLIYWLFVAAAFTYITFLQIDRRYQKPMEGFAQVTRKVASGDFSVYMPQRHLPDKQDYLDVIIADFNIMIEALGSIETLKTEFFSNVSHEIKTPLSVIQNYAQALKSDKLLEAQRAEYVDTILESSAKLNDLITNLLKLNKLENQNLQPLSDPYDLCAQLSECALRFEDLWLKKDIEFIADIEDRATIDADESLMEIVWNNLISNAIKFSNPGGIVTLQQTSTDSEIIVTISDTGCGMDEKTANHIFDKFFQGDTSHATEGNGLGLSLVLRILQIMNGTITVSSIEGKGSTFTVRMPSSSITQSED